MSGLAPAEIAAEIAAVNERLASAARPRLDALVACLGGQSSVTVGRALAAVFPDSATEPARQRALLRLIDAVNAAAGAAGVVVRLETVGAKQRGDERLIGLTRARLEQATGRADLAESQGLPPLGARRADVSSDKPTVRVALWSADEDRNDAALVWQPLKAALGVLAGVTFEVRNPRAETLAGSVVEEAHRGTARRGTARPRALAGVRPDAREAAANGIADHLAALAGRHGQRVPAGTTRGGRSLPDEGESAEFPHGKVADYDRATGRQSLLHRTATAGFEAGRTSADILDVDALLRTWASDPDVRSLLALLGDSGIGKTIAVQRLVRGLWHRPGGPAAHYFDLRDVSGIGCWREIPPVQDILAACIAGGWTDGSHPIDIDAAKSRVADLLDDSMPWPTLLVIDGLDEVLVHLPTADGQKFTNQLLRLRPAATDSIVGWHSKLMLTCRTHYFTDIREQVQHFRDQGRGTLREDDYTSLVLLPVTRAKIAAYLASALGWDEPRVEAFLTSIHDLWDLASSPYLLSKLAEVVSGLRARQERGEAIAAASVYDEIVRNWLARDYGKDVIDPSDKPGMMAYTAYRLWADGSRSAGVRDLSRWLAEYIQREDLGFRYTGKPPELLANDLHTATFLVRYDEGNRGMFRFAHSSTAEYFLAAWMIRCVERDDRAGWAMNVPGRETLQFFTDLLATHHDRARLLATLANWRAPHLHRASEVHLACGLHAHRRGEADIPLTRIDLGGADLRDLAVTGTSQRRVNLAGANLAGARLNRSRLDHVILRGADVRGAILDHAVWNEVIGGDDGAAWIWDAGTGEMITTLSGHTGGVVAVAVAGDGRVVTGGADGTAPIWDAGTGEALAISAAVGGSWATWIPGPHPDLLAAGGDAWRWLRLRVFDAQGRFVRQDPYEWYFPTRGRGAVTGTARTRQQDAPRA